MGFGEKLYQLRKEKNISQEQLAKQLGVSRQSISKWENDQGYPEVERILKLTKIFEVDANYLFDETIFEKDDSNQTNKKEKSKLRGLMIGPKSGKFGIGKVVVDDENLEQAFQKIDDDLKNMFK